MTLDDFRVSTREEWLAAGLALLDEEKRLTRQMDAISAKRRALPWVKIDKQYWFDSPAGRVSLADLFGGRRQLVVQHFMLGPGWVNGCKSCSYMADHLECMLPHLGARDVKMLAVSRAPLAEIDTFKRKMGWEFDWVCSSGNTFNQDFHVSFTEAELASGPVEYNYSNHQPPVT